MLLQNDGIFIALIYLAPLILGIPYIHSEFA